MADVGMVSPSVGTRTTGSGQTPSNAGIGGVGGRPGVGAPVEADPSRVVRTNEQAADAAQMGRGSNFESFVKALRSMPELMDIYNDVFMTKLTNPATLASYGTGFADTVYEFMDQIDMTPEQLTNLLKEQNSLSNKFTGPFFDIVRNMVSNGSSRELTVAVLEFLKRYDAVTSNAHSENVMLSNIRGIASNIPRSKSAQLSSLMQTYPANGTHAEKLAFLKNQVMPFLTKYVSQTHDYGVARDMTAMFAVNLGKFETGSMEAFTRSFTNLAGYMQLSGMLDGIDVSALQERLLAGFDQSQENHGTRVMDAFVDILTKGLSGDAGASNKAAFSDMVSSLLLNESVYMPLTHLVIPANIDGRMMFSEMWVDPDAEGQGMSGGDAPKASKIFAKFMIKELGDFDLLIVEKDGRASVEVHYPESLADRASDIRRDIPDIIRRNGLRLENFLAAQGQTEKSLLQIFPKVVMQKSTVDVTI